MWPYRRIVVPIVYALVVFNVGALWIGRGAYVPGWDLFGATFGVLALNEAGSFSDALHRVTTAFLAQKGRSVFTGGESYVHGLLPGLLNQAVPWLLWGNLVCLVLVVVVLAWLARRLPCRLSILCACMLASPALVSQSIVGLPHLPSTAVPFGLAIGYCLTEARSRRGLPSGIARDVVVFVAVTFYAFNGYESGKTFWVIPIIGALTLPGVNLVRRIVWIGCAVAIARLTYETKAMTTVAALAAVPHEPWAFLAGLARIPRRYILDWWIDFPALLLATVPALVLLRTERAFWTVTLLVAGALVSLSAFQFDGGFLVPHRFLLLMFVCALIVARVLSDQRAPSALGLLIGVLLGSGAMYTTWTTIEFLREPRTYERRDYNFDRVYPLPYNHSSFENHLWLDRIHDSITAVDLVRKSSGRHLFLYGFSALAEDGVNPQLFVARILLPLGYRRFAERVAFFDHGNEMFFEFPIAPLGAVPGALADTSVPFFLHVREPEYSGASVVARYLNAATIEPIDVGLLGFRSYRVSAYAPPGPIPIQPPDEATGRRIAAVASTLDDGWCLTTWDQPEAGHSPLRHWEQPMPGHLDQVLKDAAVARYPNQFSDVVRHRVREPEVTFTQSAVAHFNAYVDNPTAAPLEAQLTTMADDEVVILINGQTIDESLGPKASVRYEHTVLLPPGTSELRILYHKFWRPGGMTFRATVADGRPIRWQCPTSFVPTAQ